MRTLALARSEGTPVVFLFDSDGVRVEGGLDAILGAAEMLRAIAETSGHVPLLAGILGVASGAAAYAAALCDMVVAVRQRSFAFVAGPAVVRAAIGQEIGLDGLGGTRTHEEQSGYVHATEVDDGAVVAKLRTILSYVAQDASSLPSRFEPRMPEAGASLADRLPRDRQKPYDAESVVACVVDAGTYVPLSRAFGASIQVGFARIDGRSVALVTSQPRSNAGALDADASQKLARFVRFAAAFNLPVVTLCDTPGFLPGPRSERQRILVHGAKVIAAYTEAARTVPLVAVVVRRAVGAGSVMMFGADALFALPGYEYSAMGEAAGGALAALLGGVDERRASDREPVRVVQPAGLRDALANALGCVRAPTTATKGERKFTLHPL